MEVVEAPDIMLRLLLCDFGWDNITNEDQNNNASTECVYRGILFHATRAGYQAKNRMPFKW